MRRKGLFNVFVVASSTGATAAASRFFLLLLFILFFFSFPSSEKYVSSSFRAAGQDHPSCGEKRYFIVTARPTGAPRGECRRTGPPRRIFEKNARESRTDRRSGMISRRQRPSESINPTPTYALTYLRACDIITGRSICIILFGRAAGQFNDSERCTANN
jgi:hypothetical protein